MRVVYWAIAWGFLILAIVGSFQGDDDRFWNGLILCWLASIVARQEDAKRERAIPPDVRTREEDDHE